jgi:hypothetical protein
MATIKDINNIKKTYNLNSYDIILILHNNYNKIKVYLQE